MEPVVTLKGPLMSVSVVSSSVAGVSRSGGPDPGALAREGAAEQAAAAAAVAALRAAAARLDAWRRDLPARIESQLVDLERAAALGLQTHLFQSEALFFADLTRRGLA